MAGNFKKSKQKRSKTAGKRLLPNLQNKRGFTPLRRAILDQTVKKIVGNNLSDSNIDDPEEISPEIHQPQFSRQQIPEENKNEEKLQKMISKKEKYSAELAGDYMDFALAVTAQPKSDFLKTCSSYLDETKQQLQAYYFARRQNKEDIQPSPPEQPNPTFQFSPQAVTSSPQINPLNILRKPNNNLENFYPISSQMKACPYCGRDFSPAQTITEATLPLQEKETTVISPDFSFTYYPHKF